MEKTKDEMKHLLMQEANISEGSDAFEAGLGIESIMESRNPQLYLLLLKVIAGIRVELEPSDAELAAFLWKERARRRLRIDETYGAFARYLEQERQKKMIVK